MDRKQWFIDRIGKRVYRNSTHCNNDKCIPCKNVYKNGIVITDKQHATYLYDIECDYNREGKPLRYFDTLEEMLEFEKNI